MDELDLLKQKTATLILTARFNPNHGKDGRFTVGGGGGKTGSGAGTSGNLGQAVKSESDKVKSRLSNEAKPIQKQDVDMAEVKSRGNVNEQQARECVAIANNVYDNAASKEPTITNDVVSSVEDVGGAMYGLDYRLKQPTSMAGKIGADAGEDGISFEQAGANIKDSVRYTAVLNQNTFTSDYQSIKASMESKGYTEVRCKNYYDMYENNKSCQKAVQCVFSDSSGFNFEFQFHTVASQGAKELNHPLYEKQRKATTSDKEKKSLDSKMRKIGSYVPNPPDVMSINSHN